MSYLIICRANADITETRRRLRAAHLEYILQHREQISFGGPILSEDRSCMVGMVTLLDVPERELAVQFVRDEPYCRAGMFTEITIDPWITRIPEPETGFLRQELERERTLAAGPERPSNR